MTFGQRLRQLRLQKRMNQQKLATAAHIDVTYLSKIETGKMDPPAEDTVRRLAKALGEDPTELLILAKKIPSDVRAIVTESPEVSLFLRTAKQQRWGAEEWRRLRRKAEQDQLNLFDMPDQEASPP